MPEHAGYHEPLDELSQAVRERHRAIVSLTEELEAIDWYDQRVDATSDESLRAVLAHNRDEEREHAAMTLEWLRRNDPVWAEHLATYLDTQGPITEIEADAQEAGDAAAAPSSSVDGSLGIGSLKGK